MNTNVNVLSWYLWYLCVVISNLVPVMLLCFIEICLCWLVHVIMATMPFLFFLFANSLLFAISLLVHLILLHDSEDYTELLKFIGNILNHRGLIKI